MCFLLFDLLKIKILFSFQVNFPLCLQFPISPKPWFRHTWLELTSLESSFVFSSPCCFLRDECERSFPHVCGFFPTQAPRGFQHAAVVGCWLQLPVPTTISEMKMKQVSPHITGSNPPATPVQHLPHQGQAPGSPWHPKQGGIHVTINLMMLSNESILPRLSPCANRQS